MENIRSKLRIFKILDTDYVYVCGVTSGIFINYRNPNDYMIANLFDDVLLLN